MSSTTSPSTERPSDSQSTPLWLKRVPMITGVLAGLAGFLTVRSANMSNLANHSSIQAVLHQARASDHWSEYQADSLKYHNDQTALRAGIINDKDRTLVETESKDFKSRQPPLADAAHDEERQRDEQLFDGDEKLAVKDLLDYSGVAAQLGIALASIAALSRQKIWYQFGIAAGVIAILVTAFALVHPYLMPFLHHRL